MPRGPTQLQQHVIPFPIKGIDRSQPANAQPDLTTPGALNVRGLQVDTGAYLGGRRAGIRRFFKDQAGSSSGRRVNALAVVPRTVISAASTSGSQVPIGDNFTTANYAASGASAPDFLGNYAVGRKADATAWVLGSDGLRCYLNVYPQYPEGVLVVTQTGTQTQGNTFIAVNYPTTNDLSIAMLADTTVPGNVTGQYSCDGIGPFVRGSGNLQEKCHAYLEFTGQTDTVRLVIDKCSSTSRTRLMSSTREFTLSGKFNPFVFTNLGTPIIRLTSTPTSLTASVYWPEGAPGGVSDTITYNHAAGADFADDNHKRAGFALATNANSTALRFVRRAEFTRIEPYAWPVLSDMRAPIIQPGTNRYILPTGFSGSTQVNGISNLPTVTAGPQDLGAQPGYPLADTTDDRLKGGVGNGSNVATRTQILAVNATPAGSAQGLDLFYRNLSAGTDEMNPVFRLSADHRYMIRVRIVRLIDATTGATGTSNRSATYITSIIVEAIYNNAGTRTLATLATFTYDTANTNATTPFAVGSPIRWQLSGTTITASLNNATFFSYDYTTSGSWTGNVTTTAYGTLMGIDLGSAGTDPEAIGYRIVNLSPITTGVVTAGTDAVLITPAAIEVGSVDDPDADLQATTGPTFANAAIQYAILNGKVYAVDGSSTLEIDPIAKTVQPLVSESGTAPAGCSVAAIYRGRLFLAAQATNRTFSALSALGNPRNWAYGQGPVATRAVALTFANVGQPPDAITAAVPFTDDYMIVGCERSIWVLVGDPGANGTLQNVSNDTGFLGPRAWCYSDSGAVFFLGQSGLYIMRKYNEYEPIGSARLSGLLDRIDTTRTLAELGFDPVTQCVHVMLTPYDIADGPGLHVVYHVPLDALWEDQYPVRVGPWSLGRMAGASEQQRRFLMGGNDGYVYQFDDEQQTDNGEPIQSFVKCAAIEMAYGDVVTMAHELDAELQVGSADVGFTWLTGENCGDVAAPDADRVAAYGTLKADEPNRWSLRTAAGAHLLELRQTPTRQAPLGAWTFNRATVTLEARGRRREVRRV